jgi:putative heme-binding domain-containing protein
MGTRCSGERAASGNVMEGRMRRCGRQSIWFAVLVCCPCCMTWADEPPPQAGNADVARIMRDFPGRGDLGDGSEPRSPEATLEALRVPDDLAIDLIASEPLIAQPLQISFDEQGRMWVVEYRQYPFPAGLKVVRYDQHLRAVFDRVPAAPPNHEPGRDRVSVFTDTDGDGTFDKHQVAIDGLSIATSVAVGHGGIWVMNPPYLLFYPDADGDAVPDAEPVVHLAGFGLEDTHSVANSLLFGPDGWLYGVNGSTTTAKVVVPLGNQPPLAFEGQCVWRYHPQEHRFEIFAEGGGNPFGLELDAAGELFSGTNWGDTRGMHYVQGAYGVKNWGKHGPLTNPYALGFFNHMGFVGDGRRFTEEMVVYDDVVLPQRYRGQLVAVNPLQRIVIAANKIPEGSTYRTEDFENTIETTDRWFRPVDIVTGPDGCLYLADWYDTRLTHVDPRDNWHKTSGRIYRLRPTRDPAASSGAAEEILSRRAFDLRSLDDEALLSLLDHPSRFFRRGAVEQLAVRGSQATRRTLRDRLQRGQSQRLEDLWVVFRLSGREAFATDADLLHAVAHSENPDLRRWLVRLLGDGEPWNDAVVNVVAELASRETDLRVRSQLASTAKRIEGDCGLAIALAMCAADRSDDRTDPHLPLLLWWAVEAHADDPAGMLVDALASMPALWASQLFTSTVSERLARRCGLKADTRAFEIVETALEMAPTDALRGVIVRGFDEGLAARDVVELPESLAASLAEARSASPIADLVFRLRQGEADAATKAMSAIRDRSLLVGERLQLIEAVAEVRAEGGAATLLGCLGDESLAVRRAALVGLARFDDASIGSRVASGYQSMDSSTGLRPIAIRVLTSRPEWTKNLIEKIDLLEIPAEVVTPDMLVQMQTHGDEDLVAAIQRIWGTVRATPEEKLAQMERLATLALDTGDRARGNLLFAEHCGKCHRLFGAGGEVGPDLTGYERTNVDFLTLAIADPSAAIREEYTTYRVLTTDGQVTSGLLLDRTEGGVVLRTAEGQTLRFSTEEIESYDASPVSLMPDNVVSTLSDDQLRDLLAYLMEGP